MRFSCCLAAPFTRDQMCQRKKPRKRELNLYIRSLQRMTGHVVPYISMSLEEEFILPPTTAGKQT